MKITLFIIGLIVAAIAFIMDVQDDVKPAGMGYFLLSGAMLIASAIWKTDMITKDYCRAMQRVYAALAQGPMEMDELMEKLVGHSNDPSAYEHYQAAIGRMLSKRQLIIHDGKVTIGEGMDSAA